MNKNRRKKNQKKKKKRYYFVSNPYEHPDDDEIRWFINLKKYDPEMVRLILRYIEYPDEKLIISLYRLTARVHPDALPDLIHYILNLDKIYIEKILNKKTKERPLIMEYLHLFARKFDIYDKLIAWAMKHLNNEMFDYMLSADLDPNMDADYYCCFAKKRLIKPEFSIESLRKYFREYSRFANLFEIIANNEYFSSYFDDLLLSISKRDFPFFIELGLYRIAIHYHLCDVTESLLRDHPKHIPSKVYIYHSWNLPQFASRLLEFWFNAKRRDLGWGFLLNFMRKFCESSQKDIASQINKENKDMWEEFLAYLFEKVMGIVNRFGSGPSIPRSDNKTVLENRVLVLGEFVKMFGSLIFALDQTKIIHTVYEFGATAAVDSAYKRFLDLNFLSHWNFEETLNHSEGLPISCKYLLVSKVVSHFDVDFQRHLIYNEKSAFVEFLEKNYNNEILTQEVYDFILRQGMYEQAIYLFINNPQPFMKYLISFSVAKENLVSNRDFLLIWVKYFQPKFFRTSHESVKRIFDDLKEANLDCLFDFRSLIKASIYLFKDCKIESNMKYILEVMMFYDQMGIDLMEFLIAKPNVFDEFKRDFENYFLIYNWDDSDLLADVLVYMLNKNQFGIVLNALSFLPMKKGNSKEEGKKLRKQKRFSEWILEYIDDLSDSGLRDRFTSLFTVDVLRKIKPRYFIIFKNFTESVISTHSAEDLRALRTHFEGLDLMLLRENRYAFFKDDAELKVWDGVMKVQAGMSIPDVGSCVELAKATGIPWTQLVRMVRWPKFSRWSPYRDFTIQKRSGGVRNISAPYAYLKSLQLWIKEQYLDKAVVHPDAHAFIRDRSIVSNALPHLGADLVINLDLKNFFPTIYSFSVARVFYGLTRSVSFSKILTILCTDAVRIPTIHNNERYFITFGRRFLPQGAPTSPGLSNLVFYTCDVSLSQYCESHGIVYSRYADDLSFSFSGEVPDRAGFFRDVFRIIKAHHFWVNTEKVHVLGKHVRQVVTGLVVNEGVHVSKEFHHNLRGLIHKYLKYPPPDSVEREYMRRVIEGRIAFIHAVQPERAERYRKLMSSNGSPPARP